MKLFHQLLQKRQRHRAFTVVELLIVIVVIGILATISAVMYEGATSKAVDKQLMSDLAKASDQLELDFIDNKQYPATLADANGGAGIDTTKGTDLTYVPAQDRKTYCLAATSTESGTSTYNVTQNGTIKSGACASTQLYTDPPEEILLACDSNHNGFSWVAPPASQVPQFYVETNFGASVIDNDLTSTGMYYYNIPQGAMYDVDISVQFINTAGQYSNATSSSAYFAGDCRE